MLSSTMFYNFTPDSGLSNDGFAATTLDYVATLLEGVSVDGSFPVMHEFEFSLLVEAPDYSRTFFPDSLTPGSSGLCDALLIPFLTESHFGSNTRLKTELIAPGYSVSFRRICTIALMRLYCRGCALLLSFLDKLS